MYKKKIAEPIESLDGTVVNHVWYPITVQLQLI